jgi:glycerophosphoryl diester phosphodiesterase
MLIIGHRGAAGLAPENTLESLEAGYEAGADMLEIDIRLTRDKVLVMVHDAHTYRTHKKLSLISRRTYSQLLDITNGDIVRLDEVLDMYFGRVMLNIEIKNKGTGEALVKLLTKHYISSPSDWQKLIISGFWPLELLKVRKLSEDAQLSLIQAENPFAFIAYQKALRLTAVGFYWRNTNKLAVEIAKRLDLFTYVYTVNSAKSIPKLEAKGIDGVVTDYPDKIYAALNS